MKIVFERNSFSRSPGGDRYEWKQAETKFYVSENSKYLIKVVATAKNARQNRSKDDDDLRMVLDGYQFGKYEMNPEKTSFQGFNTASAWDRSALQGGTKTIFYFVQLQKGEHILNFFADETPVIHAITVFSLANNEKFELNEDSPPQNIHANRNGIPWMSFVFLGVKPRDFGIAALVQSAVHKQETDGDNVKLVLNGKILQNEIAPNSKKYKNFYFSGDLNNGKSEPLILSPDRFDFLEDSVDLWYDGKPSIHVDFSFFDSMTKWEESGIPNEIKLKILESILEVTAVDLSLIGYRYSSYFLNHSLTHQPERVLYTSESEFAKKIKEDTAYQKILAIVKKSIKDGHLEWQIVPGNSEGNSVNFEDGDLQYSLHGLKKINYQATKIGKGKYELKLYLFDVYDFDPQNYVPSKIWIFTQIADALEQELVLRDFEIEVDITDTISI